MGRYPKPHPQFKSNDRRNGPPTATPFLVLKLRQSSSSLPDQGLLIERLQATNRRDKPKAGEGATEQIAQEHYWTVSDSDLDQAIADLSPGIAQKLAQKLAHGVGSKGLGSSVDGSTANHPKTKKAREIPGFVSICRLLAEGGFPLRMAEAGLEPAQGLLPEGF